MLTTSPAGAAAALRGRAERPPYHDRLLLDLRAPALVLAGDADFFSTAEITAQLVAALPDPEVMILPGDRPHAESRGPGGFDGAVRAFAASAR